MNNIGLKKLMSQGRLAEVLSYNELEMSPLSSGADISTIVKNNLSLVFPPTNRTQNNAMYYLWVTLNF